MPNFTICNMDWPWNREWGGMLGRVLGMSEVIITAWGSCPKASCGIGSFGNLEATCHNVFLVSWSILRLFTPGGLRSSWSVHVFLPLLLPIRLCKAVVPPIRHPLINIDAVPGCWLLLSIYPSLLYYFLLPSSLYSRKKNKTNRSCWNGGEECS